MLLGQTEIQWLLMLQEEKVLFFYLQEKRNFLIAFPIICHIGKTKRVGNTAENLSQLEERWHDFT